MRVLALDSSGLVASVAVVEDQSLLAEYTVNYKKTHSQTLLPMLDTIAEMIELDMQSVDAVAVASGPGSFTGLRIGAATAKGLGLALGKPLVAIPTLEALAFNLYGTKGVICPLMDARRNQVYTGIYQFCGDAIKVIYEQAAVDIVQIIQQLNEQEEEVIYLGDGVPVHAKTIEQQTKVPYRIAPAHLNKQRAGAVGVLAQQYIKQGKVQTAAAYQPDYLRMSQAERERAQQEKEK